VELTESVGREWFWNPRSVGREEGERLRVEPQWLWIRKTRNRFMEGCWCGSCTARAGLVAGAEHGVILFGRQKPEASTSLPKILRQSTKPTFRRF
jgi:hypothetical protein